MTFSASFAQFSNSKLKTIQKLFFYDRKGTVVSTQFNGENTKLVEHV